MNFALLLAQTGSLSVLQWAIDQATKLRDAGIAVICLVIAIIAVLFAYRQLNKVNNLQEEFRERIDQDAKALQTEQKTLLREMLDSEKASRETILEANKNVEVFEQTLEGVCKQVSDMDQRLSVRIDKLVDELSRRRDV